MDGGMNGGRAVAVFFYTAKLPRCLGMRLEHRDVSTMSGIQFTPAGQSDSLPLLVRCWCELRRRDNNCVCANPPHGHVFLCVC